MRVGITKLKVRSLKPAKGGLGAPALWLRALAPATAVFPTSYKVSRGLPVVRPSYRLSGAVPFAKLNCMHSRWRTYALGVRDENKDAADHSENCHNQGLPFYKMNKINASSYHKIESIKSQTRKRRFGRTCALDACAGTGSRGVPHVLQVEQRVPCSPSQLPFARDGALCRIKLHAQPMAHLRSGCAR